MKLAKFFKGRKIFFAPLILAMLANYKSKAEEAPIAVNKTRISDEALAAKREGKYWAAFPGAGYSPDMGLILAGVVSFYNNGKKEAPYFAYAPYQRAAMLAASWSTKGMASLLADYDAPYFKDSPYRLRGRLWYLRNLTEPYFGVDESSQGALTIPDGRTFSSYSDYYDEIRLNQDGQTNAYYNYYLNQFLLGYVNVERDLFGGLARLGGGLFLSRTWVHDYTGDSVPGLPAPGAKNTEEAEMRETLLSRDARAGKIVGFNGGWNNTLRFGLAYDTRDFESNPRRGMFHDVTFAWSNKAWGSTYNYSITTATARFFVNPLPDWWDVILAARLGYSLKAGETPFFAMNYIPTTDKHVYGLGGEYTMRGYRLSRFVGPVMLFGNLEARWIFADFKIGRGQLELMAVPFFDFGRVYNKVSRTTLVNMKYSYGLGIRMAVSQSFVVSFDFGFSEEEQGSFYVTFGNMF